MERSELEGLAVPYMQSMHGRTLVLGCADKLLFDTEDPWYERNRMDGNGRVCFRFHTYRGRSPNDKNMQQANGVGPTNATYAG